MAQSSLHSRGNPCEVLRRPGSWTFPYAGFRAVTAMEQPNSLMRKGFEELKEMEAHKNRKKSLWNPPSTTRGSPSRASQAVDKFYEQQVSFGFPGGWKVRNKCGTGMQGRGGALQEKGRTKQDWLETNWINCSPYLRRPLQWGNQL